MVYQYAIVWFRQVGTENKYRVEPLSHIHRAIKIWIIYLSKPADSAWVFLLSAQQPALCHVLRRVMKWSSHLDIPNSAKKSIREWNLKSPVNPSFIFFSRLLDHAELRLHPAVVGMLTGHPPAPQEAYSSPVLRRSWLQVREGSRTSTENHRSQWWATGDFNFWEPNM